MAQYEIVYPCISEPQFSVEMLMLHIYMRGTFPVQWQDTDMTLTMKIFNHLFKSNFNIYLKK